MRFLPAFVFGLQPGCVPPPPMLAGDPAPSGAFGCASAELEAEHAHLLLRIACDGTLVPGRANWSVEGAEVTLEFAPGEEGLVGAELAGTWPPFGGPPWLGHSVVSVTVTERGGIAVRFADPGDEPARLFADPRLSGEELSLPEVGDVRDAIDAGDSEVVTHHRASIEYAVALGRDVRPAGFGRMYLIVFAGPADMGPIEALSGPMSRDWVNLGAPGARSLPAHGWTSLRNRCSAGSEGAAGGDPPVVSAVLPVGPTVAFRQDDPAAREAAERLVSAGIRGGSEAEAVAALAGGTGRLAVRGTDRSPPRRAPSDAAAVLWVFAGPGHPCSLHAEVLRAVAEWDARGEAGSRPAIMLLGGLEAFVVSRPEEGGP
ncbi:MAG: hypothetical protein F4059_03285 [Gemmatimonadetes bacterium]|nr:hypothetical protein [Gemmatimonadota bacterium]